MSKQAIELILERTLSDAEFRASLLTDPPAACAPFDLTDAEFRELLGQAFSGSQRLDGTQSQPRR